MSKAKLYKINNNDNKSNLLQFIVGIIVYAAVLMITASLFEKFDIENFGYAVIAALILSGLNYTIKPLLIFLTLPLNIITFGIAYPIVNMIILKLCDLILGDAFVLSGLLSTFVVAIFISILKIIFDSLITKRFGGR